MANKKKIIILSIIAVIAVFAFFGVKKIPALKVEGQKISYGNFLKIKGALEKFNKISDVSLGEDMAQIALLNLIEQEFLDVLIDNVDRNLRFEAEKITKEAIEKTPNLSLDKASKELYGLSASDFRNLVLLPQAKRDILNKYYKDRGRDILQSWASLYGTAAIKVYYPGYYWDTTEYTIKKK